MPRRSRTASTPILSTSSWGHGYAQTTTTREFQLQRTVPARDGGPDIEVLVDFLMPKHAVIEKNRPKLIEHFRVQRADGADLAIHFHQMVAVTSPMPAGGRNTVEIAVCSIPALLAMKGYALEYRHKNKDAYDIYYCIRHYPGGPYALAEDCKPLLHHESALRGTSSSLQNSIPRKATAQPMSATSYRNQPFKRLDTRAMAAGRLWASV